MGSALCGGFDRHYRARVRLFGHQRYELLGKPTKSLRVAMTRVTDAMAAAPHYKRGDVLVCDDWYEPFVLFETVRV